MHHLICNIITTGISESKLIVFLLSLFLSPVDYHAINDDQRILFCIWSHATNISLSTFWVTIAATNYSHVPCCFQRIVWLTTTDYIIGSIILDYFWIIANGKEMNFLPHPGQVLFSRSSVPYNRRTNEICDTYIRSVGKWDFLRCIYGTLGQGFATCRVDRCLTYGILITSLSCVPWFMFALSRISRENQTFFTQYTIWRILEIMGIKVYCFIVIIRSSQPIFLLQFIKY